MQIRSVGIDLGKTTFHLVALDDNGKVILKKKFTQKQSITFTANMQTSLIGMEACGGAHFLGRALRAHAGDPLERRGGSHAAHAQPAGHAVERVEGSGASDWRDER